MKKYIGIFLSITIALWVFISLPNNTQDIYYGKGFAYAGALIIAFVITFAFMGAEAVQQSIQPRDSQGQKIAIDNITRFFNLSFVVTVIGIVFLSMQWGIIFKKPLVPGIVFIGLYIINFILAVVYDNKKQGQRMKSILSILASMVLLYYTYMNFFIPR